MGNCERGMNPVAMTIINSWKEYWPSLGSNQRPPVLKSALRNRQSYGGSAVMSETKLESYFLLIGYDILR